MQKMAQSSLQSEGRQANKGLDKKGANWADLKQITPSLVLFQKVKVN